ncbi:hypothetical protein E2320_000060, partial [Naja naja]
AEHPGMRTYYFSADTQLDMNSWIRAMNQSAAAECNCGNLSLSSQTHGCPSPISCTKFSSRPRTPLPPSSESPPPPSPSRISQPSPVFSLRSSRAYSLPVAPAESPKLPQAHPSDMHDAHRSPHDAHRSPHDAHRSPPRSVVAQAASCDDLSIMSSPRTLHANIPMGRVDIAPNKCLPNNPYAVVSPAHKGHSLTPADRYDVFPTSEDSYARRYAQSPHLHRVRPFTDRGYVSPSVGPSRALVMSRLHGRLITPHSASSSYLHLPPLPPLPTRPTPGKRTSVGITALLTKLCGQDKVLRGLEEETGQLHIEKERLEKALEVTHLRLEEFKGQDATVEKICYQQRQLQDELVHTRARLCDLALDSERVWEDYTALENDVQMLKGSLEHIRTSGHPQDQAAAQQDLWRIHDILAGLRCSPANYRTLENRRSGVSPSSPPPLDSNLGANHHPLLSCTETEESTPSCGPETGKPARMGSKQQDVPGSANWQQSPSTSSRGQLGASQHVDGLKGSPNHSYTEPPESGKGKLGRGADSIRP